MKEIKNKYFTKLVADKNKILESYDEYYDKNLKETKPNVQSEVVILGLNDKKENYYEAEKKEEKIL